ncbi:hypothetical protein LSUE1_G009326 [Lachnellula suecica]|uniref:Uncharacterized protein n=1 Tax=Lachnellula suecica TaxID=602035 RepID=A0A8T9BVD4_9HELO|nr:hypothetical protein LSUE1_G009326 [Lachnellula suecica]
MSAHSRPDNSGPIVPPSGPRGFSSSTRGAGGFMRGGGGSFGNERQSRPDSGSWGAAPASRTAPAEVLTRGSTPASRPTQTPSPSIPSGPSVPSIPTVPSAGIPTGPRAGVPTRPSIHSSNVYNRNTQANVPPAGPRPHPAMANLPQIIPGGRIDPTATGITPDVSDHLRKLQEQEVVLRADYDKKRQGLMENLKILDRLQREGTDLQLRSELSERHVRMLAGEGVGGAAF